MSEGQGEAPADDVATNNDEPKENRFDLVMKYIAAGSVLIGGAIGLWQYLDTAQKSYRQPLWERQLPELQAKTAP